MDQSAASSYSQFSGSLTEESLNTWANAEHYETYLALLGLSESLRKQGEPEGAFRSLMAILSLHIPYAVSARIYCEIGKLLMHQSTDYTLAQQYLEQSFQMTQNAIQGGILEDTKLDSASSLADLYVLQDKVTQARDILHSAIEQSQHSPYWQCHFIFQLSNVFVQSQDFTVATQILVLGESFSARHQAQFLTLLFQLTRTHVQLRSKQHQAALASLNDIRANLENSVSVLRPILREELRFHLAGLEVICRTGMGQAKSAMPAVQVMQNSLESLSQLRQNSSSGRDIRQPLEMFALMVPSNFPLVTYAVSAAFFGLLGYHDKLERAVGRGLTYLDGIEGLDGWSFQEEFRCALYSISIPAALTAHRFTTALTHVAELLTVCAQTPRLMNTRRCQLHSLLGLCALQFGYNEVAESQFTLAYRCCTTSETLNMLNLNQAMLLFKQQRFSELATVLQRTRPDQLTFEHVVLRSACLILQGLAALVERRYVEGKMILQNALAACDKEDLHQLTAVSLVLMARTCAPLGDLPGMVKVARMASDLAERIPDPSIHMACLTSLSEAFGLMGDVANQNLSATSAHKLSQREAQELQLVQRNPKLNMLQWTG